MGTRSQTCRWKSGLVPIRTYKYIFSTIPLLLGISNMLMGQRDSVLMYTKYKGGKPFERFYADPADSVRNGAAEIFLLDGSLLGSGSYSRNEKVGIWIYQPLAEHNQQGIEYDHDKNREIKYYGKASVRNLAEAAAAGVQYQEAHFPGGHYLLSVYLQNALVQEFGPTRPELANLGLSFKINAKGNIVELRFLDLDKKVYGFSGMIYETYTFSSTSEENTLRKIFSTMPIWFPEIKEGKPVLSEEIILPIHLDIQSKVNSGIIGRQVPWGRSN